MHLLQLAAAEAHPRAEQGGRRALPPEEGYLRGGRRRARRDRQLRRDEVPQVSAASAPLEEHHLSDCHTDAGHPSGVSCAWRNQPRTVLRSVLTPPYRFPFPINPKLPFRLRSKRHGTENGTACKTAFWGAYRTVLCSVKNGNGVRYGCRGLPTEVTAGNVVPRTPRTEIFLVTSLDLRIIPGNSLEVKGSHLVQFPGVPRWSKF